MADTKDLIIKQIGNYRFLGKTLGKGNFAKVELGEHKLTGVKVAIKVINIKTIKEDYVKRNILREALIMKKINHENVIKLYETLKYGGLYCLVTELAKGGDLRSYVQQQKNKKLIETRARSFFRQLLSAVKHLHDSGIVHRDLKMDNILLDETKTVLKIVDFGLSNFFNKGELLRTHCGSPEYAAPELFEKGCLYGPSVDVWSMGVILYGMVIGHLPFSTIHQGFVGKDELYRSAKKGLSLIHEKYLGKISNGCRSLISTLLQPDSTRRISFDQMMHHFWVTEDGKSPLLKMPPFFVPKFIRNQIIDRVATLCCKSVPDAEFHIQESKHDAVCATYNLLLDEAVKDYKSRTRFKSRSRSSSAQSNMLSDSTKAFTKIEGKTATVKSSDEQQVGANALKCENGNCVQKDNLNETAATNKSVKSTTSSNKTPFSSVRIVDFTDAINLEGRGNSPIIRKPPSVRKYWKAYTPLEASKQSLHFKITKKSLAEKASLDSTETKTECKRQLFCGEISNEIGKTCKITRFPEEERSSNWPKCESPLGKNDPKHVMFAAGFRLTSLAKKMKEISTNRSTKSFHGYSAKNVKEKAPGSKSFDTSIGVGSPNTLRKVCSNDSGSGQQHDSANSVRRRSVARDTMRRNGDEIKSQASEAKNDKRQKINAKRTVNSSPQRMQLVKNSSSICNKKQTNRFGIAMRELQRSTGYVTSKEKIGTIKYKRKVKDEELKDSKGVQKDDVKKVDESSKRGEESEENKCELEISANQITRTSEKIRTVEIDTNDSSEACPKICTKDEDKKLELKAAEDGKCEGDICEYVNDMVDGQAAAPRCQSVAFIDDQRKLSNGILKAPSRCSSADVVTGNGKEKRKLRVTFEDEVFHKLQKQIAIKAKNRDLKAKKNIVDISMKV